jgi:hypothetical protein
MCPLRLYIFTPLHTTLLSLFFAADYSLMGLGIKFFKEMTMRREE